MRAVLVILMCIFLGWILVYTNLSFNHSPSLPYDAFFCIKHMPPKRGTLVCIKGHKSAYTKGKHLTKRLVGLPGDPIVCEQGILFAAGDKVGPVHPKTLDGRLLTPQNAVSVPDGFAFVAGTHDRSFDSRYLEFDLVPLDKICGRCFGLRKYR